MVRVNLKLKPDAIFEQHAKDTESKTEKTNLQAYDIMYSCQQPRRDGKKPNALLSIFQKFCRVSPMKLPGIKYQQFYIEN